MYYLVLPGCWYIVHRLACHFNSYRLFYGIFFAEAPIVKRHLQSRASSIVGKRSRVFEGNSRQSIVRNINIEVLSLKIARAPINVYRKVEAAATHITLQHFRSHVIADQMKQMQHMNRRPSMVIPSPRNQAAVRTNGSFRNSELCLPVAALLQSINLCIYIYIYYFFV